MSMLYAPGGTPVAVTPRGFAVLEPGVSAALLTRVRALLADGRGLGGVIEALTGAYGASLTAIPSFAVALAEPGGVRVAVRGDFVFEIVPTPPPSAVPAAPPLTAGASSGPSDGGAPGGPPGASGRVGPAPASERVSGTGVTTWTERVIPEVARVTLVTSEPESSAPAEFEIADGVVLAAGIVWDAAAAAPSAVPVAEGAPLRGRNPVSDAASAGEDDRRQPGVRRVGTPAAQDLDEPAASIDDDLSLSEGQRDEASPAASIDEERSPSERREGEVSSGLIDSRAVLSIADAETLLPLDSALTPEAAVVSPITGRTDIDAKAAGSVDPWSATVIRSTENAAAPSGAAAAGNLADVVAPAGDHDGATISLAQARTLRNAASADLPDAVPSPLAPPRPPAPGRIRMSTGQVLLLDRTVVIGRRPRSTRVSGTDLPHLVAVDSPQQDISRSHLELRVEGESIVATDLRTTNGTTLLRPGSDPVRLHPGEGAVVIVGDVLDLGDGVTVTIEGLA